MGCQIQKSQTKNRNFISRSNPHLICSKKVQGIINQLSQPQLRTRSKSSTSREQTPLKKQDSRQSENKLVEGKSNENIQQTGLVKIQQQIQQHQILDITPKFGMHNQMKVSKSVEYLPPSWQSLDDRRKSDLFQQGFQKSDIRIHFNLQR